MPIGVIAQLDNVRKDRALKLRLLNQIYLLMLIRIVAPDQRVPVRQIAHRVNLVLTLLLLCRLYAQVLQILGASILLLMPGENAGVKVALFVDNRLAFLFHALGILA